MCTRMLTAAALALSIAGCNTATLEQKAQSALALTPEHFASTATIKDGPLDTIATITTYNGYQEKHGLLGIVWNDNFLRAFIDKKSKEINFQLYQVITYGGSDWNFYQTINFETPTGPESKSVIVVNRDVSCSGSYKCSYSEELAVNIDGGLLRAIANVYQPNQPAGWKFKFNAKSGREFNDGMLATEIVGFLQAVDSYRAANLN